MPPFTFKRYFAARTSRATAAKRKTRRAAALLAAEPEECAVDDCELAPEGDLCKRHMGFVGGHQSEYSANLTGRNHDHNAIGALIAAARKHGLDVRDDLLAAKAKVKADMRAAIEDKMNKVGAELARWRARLPGLRAAAEEARRTAEAARRAAEHADSEARACQDFHIRNGEEELRELRFSLEIMDKYN
jgi:hypothetical protein